LAVTYLSWIFTGEGASTASIWTRGFFNGVAATGTTLMSVSMLPDLMEYDRLRTGERREGVYSSLYTIVEKIGYAIGPGLIGLLLAASGFVATTRGAIVEQPDSAIRALYVGMAILPSVLVVASFVMMLFYRIDEKRLQEERARVAALDEADSVPTT
jgi:GPH family glycoside/pentoside/hexuronide:cation symporter